MHRVGWLAAAFIAAAAGVLVLWGTNWPLGWPGEWTWPRLLADASSGGNAILAGLVAGLYLAFVIWGSQRLSAGTLSRVESVLWPAGLMLAAGGWLWTVQETAPPAGQLAKAPFVLYYPSSSGYFYMARYESPAVGPFLAGYEELMSEGDVLHVGTHPPGLFLVFHGLTGVVEGWPVIGDAAWTLAPESFRETADIVAENTRFSPHPLSPVDARILWLATLLVLGCAAATVLPLYGILRLWLPREAAFAGAALWPTLPAVAIFVPKSDAAFPFVATLLAWLVLSGWSRGSVPRAILSGLVLLAGLFCSLAFLPVALWLTLMVGHDGWRRLRSGERSPLSVLLWCGCGIAGFVLPVLLIVLLGDLHLERIWWWNYRNHAGFYAKYPRTYWKWLLLNPIELTLAAGAPLTVAAIAGLRRAWAGRHKGELSTLAIGWGATVWGLLWLTGKNSGEAARLWLLFLPGLTAVAACGIAGGGTSSTEEDRSSIRWLWLCLALQLATSMLTVHRVGGFHFDPQ
jgi:methylthioxylose transferase